ncbi:unnamed protein product [Knipowitschia caucasica]|uniref:Neutral cholesterol ester hydrolase 1 n=1 Tax=Knipowitschia caucasica TaxID=637954 RepID=A0AAV2L8Y9_KNICA
MWLLVAGLGLLLAAVWYVWSPLPPGVCEPGKLRLLDALFRSSMSAAELLHVLGLVHRVQVLKTLVSLVEEVPARSCLLLDVRDTSLGGVSTRVFSPSGGAALKRAVLYFHGGGWALGSARMRSYDLLCRRLALDLDAVIMSVDYGLVPKCVFPAQYQDALSASRAFLSAHTWDTYCLDPHRLGICGDSAGANLATAVTLTLCTEASLSARFRVQALVYPVLQALDFQTSSYQQNRAVPILHRPIMVRFWLQYLGVDPSLETAVLKNLHSSELDKTTRQKIDWTQLVPGSIRKNYQPVVVDTTTKVALPSVFLDPHASPLLADDHTLRLAPPTFILTCEHDVLRDDGYMYAHRLTRAGVAVTSDHYGDGFHGCMVFANRPMMSSVGRRSEAGLVRWLHHNL